MRMTCHGPLAHRSRSATSASAALRPVSLPPDSVAASGSAMSDSTVPLARTGPAARVRMIPTFAG